MNDLKNQIIEDVNNYLIDYAKENDRKLNDKGSFSDEKNIIKWDDNNLIVNFYSISQDDFFDLYEMFEDISNKLNEIISKKVKVQNIHIEGDCPVIVFNINI